MSLRIALSVVSVSRAREWSWANQEVSVVGLADEIDDRKWMSSSVRSVRSSLGTCKVSGHARKWFLKLKVSSAVTYGATSWATCAGDWAAPPASARVTATLAAVRSTDAALNADFTELLTGMSAGVAAEVVCVTEVGVRESEGLGLAALDLMMATMATTISAVTTTRTTLP